VWSGAEAKNLGLVDEIGGLDAAVNYAAEKAGLGRSYRIVEYPQKKDMAEALAELFEKFAPATRAQAGGVVGQAMQRVRRELGALGAYNDPKGIYARMPLDLSIR